ncbi:MAG: CPBP family intramembrane metalloprotease [Planctomycetaceae bacterium]|nr:CPBP family intramembrane metalloprotease [Planctomycetaceae bacterium]
MSAAATPDQFGDRSDPSERSGPSFEQSPGSDPTGCSIPIDESTSVDPSASKTPARRGWFFRKPLFRWGEDPGFRESVLWFYAFGLIHQLSAILVGLGLAAIFFFIHGQRVDFVHALENRLFEPWLAPWLGGEQLVSLLVVLWMYHRRFLGHPAQRREFELPNFLHGLMTFLLLLPLGIISTWTYLQAERGWKWAAMQFPALENIDRMLILNAPSILGQQISFWLMLIIFAVIPAVGEELVFRGVIGRGLTRRIGVLPGVLLTSLMFGVLHGHPLHAAAVIPLGIALHALYLSTGSLITPMLLHFLNNATALLTLTSGSSFDQVLDQQRSLLDSPSIVCASALLVGCLLWGLYQTRQLAQVRQRMTPVCLGSLIVGLISFASLYCRQLFAN